MKKKDFADNCYEICSIDKVDSTTTTETTKYVTLVQEEAATLHYSHHCDKCDTKEETSKRPLTSYSLLGLPCHIPLTYDAAIESNL